jgi:predicted O-methyltransferase YrrM
MNSVLEEILRTGQVKNADGEILKLHSHVSPQQGEFLQEIMSELKPNVTLEVGLAYGISALFICDALEKAVNSRHITIDPYQLTYWKGIGLHNLKQAGYEEIIEFHNQPSHLVLAQLEMQANKIDFAFIDGHHTFDHTLIDFFLIDRLLRVGGVVAIDDTTLPSVRKVSRFIITNRSYSVFRCFNDTDSKLSLSRQILWQAAHISKPIQRILKPEYTRPDIKLELMPRSRCIAFKKEAEDTRKWNFHREF